MSAELSYLQLKTAHEARLSEEVLEDQRKKNLLILIHSHLLEQGFLDSARVLEKETGSVVRKYRVCDNIDLLTVLQEYESYYHVKFKKQPKLTKRVSGGSAETVPRTHSSKQNSCGGSVSLPSIPGLVHPVDVVPSAHHQLPLQHQRPSPTTAGQPPASNGKRKKKNLAPPTSSTPLPLELEGTAVTAHTGDEKGKKGSQMASTDHYTCSQGDYYQDRLLKPLAGFAGYSSEMRELAGVISRDIYLENPNITWNDIIGLEAPKRLVKEAVVYPIKYPQLFTGILSPWKGLLLYGPPGTGKTLLAKAVATECRTTFFNISASSIVSKWRGDSEKLVRVLFELARFHAPSTIFLDELDALMGQRSGVAGGEHEGSRRMKTELFVQMDGLARSSDLVFLLAASNLPWELDHAMLRRLEKRILVDLPSEEARMAMFSHHLPPVLSQEPLYIQTEIDYKRVAKLTEGYSGSDVLLVCKEAAMRPIRRVFDRLEGLGKDGSTNWGSIQIESIVTADIEAAIASTKPSAKKLADQYIKWQKQYESV